MADYEYMFEDKDPNALTEKWKSIEKKPFEKNQITLDRTVAAYHRDNTLHNFLTFVKFFSTHKKKFDDSVNHLIIFSEVFDIYDILSKIFLFSYNI